MKFAKSLWHLSCGVILIVTLLQNCVQSSFIGIVDIPASFYPTSIFDEIDNPASFYPTSIYDQRTHCGIRQEYPCLGAIKDFNVGLLYYDCVFMAELLVPSAVVGQDSIKHRFFVKFVDHDDNRLQYHEFLIEKLAINTIPCGVNCLRYNKAYCSSGNCISHQEITFELSMLIPVEASCRHFILNKDFNSRTISGCGADPTTKPCPLYFKHFPNRLRYIDSAGEKTCYKASFQINVCSPLSACVTAPLDQWEYIELYVYLVNNSEWAGEFELQEGIGLDSQSFFELLVRNNLQLCLEDYVVRYFIDSSQNCESKYKQVDPPSALGNSLSFFETLHEDWDLGIADCQFV